MEMNLSRTEFLKLAASIVMLSSVKATFAATGPTITSDDGSFARVQKAGKVVFGTSNDQPFDFLDPVTQVVTGIDADMLTYIMMKLGIPKREMVQTDFSGLIPGLLASRFDIVVDAMAITDKRKLQIAFTDPWYIYGDAFIVAKGNPLKIKSLDDLTKGYRGASYAGTIYMDWLNALAPKGAKISSYPAVPEMLLDFRNGRLDAALVDGPVFGYLMIKQPSLANYVEIVRGYQVRPDKTHVGAGLRKEDVALLEAVNWALSEMKKEGADVTILKKWGLDESNRAS
jgi:polar amino acid transport system substrate-binding protein